MEDFQKIIVQMLKVQMDHQQKSDESEQRMEVSLMEQQVQQQQQQQQQRMEQQQQQRNEERLLQALMKRGERQNQMEELLLKSLNGTKTSENDATFPLSYYLLYQRNIWVCARKRLSLWCILKTIWRRI